MEINSYVKNEIEGDESTEQPLKIKPVSEQQIVDAIVSTKGQITVSGVHHSLGGQIIYPESLYLDLSDFNAVLDFDADKKLITVQSGITWKEIQQLIDPHNLSIKIMPDQNDFTVGGSLSVNAHGRYVNAGPIINSVKSIRIILANGEIFDASAEKNNALFYGAIGGYGGVGVITQATVELVENIAIERNTKRLGFNEFNNFFNANILTDENIVMHYAEVYPPNYESLLDVSWRKTDKPLTDNSRLQKNKPESWWQSVLIDLKARVGVLHRFEKNLIDPYIFSKPVVVMRNLESSYNLRDSGFITSKKSTMVMQEYLIPVNRFEIFSLTMRDVLTRHKVEVYKIIVSYLPQNHNEPFSGSTEAVYSFKIIYRQEKNKQSQAKVDVWTKKLVKASLDEHGSHILPYHVYDSASQLYKAYPAAAHFFEVKKKADPDGRFSNLFWEQHQDTIYAAKADKLQIPTILNLKP